MTPKEWTEKTVKELAIRKAKREKQVNDYEAHRTGVLKAIKYKTGVYK